MADIKTTLHREDAPQDNVYPNIVADNIPAQCIDRTKVNGTIPSLNSAPTLSDAGKVVTVNSSGNGYELKDVDGAVTSVNGQTGDVTISKNDLGLAVVALTGSYDDLNDKPTTVKSVNGQTGDVTISKNDLGLSMVALTAPNYDSADAGKCLKVTDDGASLEWDNVSSSGAVTSVNGQTGDVTITKNDLGLSMVALSAPNYNIADAGKCLKVTDDGIGLEWANDNTGGGSGGAVTSVNGQTGDVTITKNDLGLSMVALSAPNYNIADAGKCLKVTDDGIGLEWANDNTGGGSGGAVTSVNGQTGDVTISKFDFGLAQVALTGSYDDLADKPDIGLLVTSVNGQTGDVTISKNDLGLSMVALNAPNYNALDAGKCLKVTNDGIGLEWANVSTGGGGDVVTSVNGQTGDVTISKFDLGLSMVALSAPDYDSSDAGKCLKVAAGGTGLEWANDNTGGGGGAVTSVNGQTGDVTISKNDLGLGLLLNKRQFVQGSTVYSGMNFNATQYMDTGSYYVIGTSDMPCYNGPSSNTSTNSNCMWALLLFKYNDEEDNITQIAISLKSVEMHIRNKKNNAWTAWTKII